MKHVHADLIKEWADGAEIEALDYDNNWKKTTKPIWYENVKYRIKPIPVPNVVKLISIVYDLSVNTLIYPNLKLTFCGIQNNLIAVELIK